MINEYSDILSVEDVMEILNIGKNSAYELFRTKALWKPTFEPDAQMLSAIGDGVFKLNQAIDGFIDEDRMRRLTGIE